MTNNAQLLPLPELSDDDLELLHYNPNTSDVVEFLHRYAQSYALACIEAAQPADAYMHIPSGACFDEVIASVDDSAIVKLTPDALGSLPVVATMAKGPVIYFTKPVENGLKDLPVGQYDLTPISYATAEIAKRDAEIERQHERMARVAKALRIAGCHRTDADRVLLSFEERAASLSAKLAGVDGLLSSMKLIATVNACDYEYQRWAREALATYEAAQGEKT